MTPTPLQTALACRCPRCGQGRLFDGFLKVVDRCDKCGLELAANDSGDGPAVFLIFILGGLGVPVAFLIDAWFTVPIFVPGLVTAVLVVALAILLLRPTKSYVLALQFRHRRDDFERRRDPETPPGRQAPEDREPEA